MWSLCARKIGKTLKWKMWGWRTCLETPGNVWACVCFYPLSFATWGKTHSALQHLLWPYTAFPDVFSSLRLFFFILCRVCVMSRSIGKKGAIYVSGTSVARVYWPWTIHSLLLLLGYMEAVSSKTQQVMLWLLREIKKINMELHVIFLLLAFLKPQGWI